MDKWENIIDFIRQTNVLLIRGENLRYAIGRMQQNQEPYISRGLVAKFSVARSVGPILELLKVVRYEIENVFVNLLDIF